MKRFRHITKAKTGHGYVAIIYLQKDGELKKITEKIIKIDETSVRLRNNETNWEEYISGCGWFRCKKPSA